MQKKPSSRLYLREVASKIAKFRNSCPGVLHKIDALKTFPKILGKQKQWCPFLIKLNLKTSNLTEKKNATVVVFLRILQMFSEKLC